MARPSSIEISGLNIAKHALHSMGRYVDPFNDELRLRTKPILELINVFSSKKQLGMMVIAVAR